MYLQLMIKCQYWYSLNYMDTLHNMCILIVSTDAQTFILIVDMYDQLYNILEC